MINLTSSGGTITFAFDNNSGYLQNGTIEVPVNSLSLVIDESDMVTFKKANSNDVFVSALASDFGMSKAQLISFYKDNMVDGGITIDSTITTGSTNPVQSSAIYDKVTITSSTEGYTNLTFDDKVSTNYPSGATKIKIVAANVTINETIDLFVGGYIGERVGKFAMSIESGVISSLSVITGDISASTSGNTAIIEFPTITNVDTIMLYHTDWYDSISVESVITTTQWLKDYVAELETRVKALEDAQNNS